MKAYYAHSLHLYDTEQEVRDISTISTLGFEVINPNNQKMQIEVEEYRLRYGGALVMDYFKDIIRKCDVVIFRAHPDGKIPSGVGFEVKYALELNMPVIELPTLTSNRFLSIEDTRYYLRLLGQR